MCMRGADVATPGNAFDLVEGHLPTWQPSKLVLIICNKVGAAPVYLSSRGRVEFCSGLHQGTQGYRRQSRPVVQDFRAGALERAEVINAPRPEMPHALFCTLHAALKTRHCSPRAVPPLILPAGTVHSGTETKTRRLSTSSRQPQTQCPTKGSRICSCILFLLRH